MQSFTSLIDAFQVVYLYQFTLSIDFQQWQTYTVA